MESLMIAHELSFADSASEVSILELLNRLLDPWRGLRRDPIAISGDKALMLAGRVVTSVALILHELATNSVKYGGLGHDQGAVRLALEHAGDDRGSARLLWVGERPGPADGDLKSVVEGEGGWLSVDFVGGRSITKKKTI